MKSRVSYILVMILLALLVVNNIPKKDIKTKIVTTTDTVICNHIDTITIDRPKIVQTIIRDTIIAISQSYDSLKLVYSNKKYSDSIYDAYVSGYNAQLDSIHVYNKTITNNIFTNTTKTIYKEKHNLYLDIGINKINGYICPNIGLSYSMPNGFKVGGELGTYNNKAYYGFKIGYKIK